MLQRALAAGVLAGAGSRLEFRHGLIRQSLYEGMPQSLRAALHLQAARRLADHARAPEQVLPHLALAPADDIAWAYDWLADAAPTLTARAPQVTAEVLRGAVARLPDSDPRRLTLRVSLIKAAYALAQFKEAEQVGTAVLAAGADPDTAAEVSWLVASAQQRDSRSAAAAESLTRALGQPQVSELWAARLRARQAMSWFQAGDADQAEEAALAAAAAGRRLGDRTATGYALHDLSFFRFYHGDLRAGFAHCEAALKVIGDDPGLSDLRVLLLSNRITFYDQLARHAEADTAVQETVALAERTGTFRLKTMRVVASEHYFEAGRWDDARAELETLAALPPARHGGLLIEHGLAALIAGHRDDRATAARHLAAVTAETDAAAWDPMVSHYLLLARALAAEQAGHPEQAVAVLAVYLDPDLPEIPERYHLLPALTRLALAAGDTATAAAAAAVAAAAAGQETVPLNAAGTRVCQALVAGDASALLDAARQYRGSRRPLGQAQVLEDAAVLLTRAGDRAAAREAFAAAIAAYRDLGADWDARRAETRLRPAGLKPGRRARPAFGWDSLTPTETKIVALIAEGRSNPDIAEQLFLSRNTVQTHVSHVLAKLGARSRGEVIREALRRAPAPQPG
jgi:DNA-binding CsgD family transcriptional regulator